MFGRRSGFLKFRALSDIHRRVKMWYRPADRSLLFAHIIFGRF